MLESGRMAMHRIVRAVVSLERFFLIGWWVEVAVRE
jgi:hypothetical protein